MAEKRLFREYSQLLKSPASHTNPDIITLVPKDPDNLFEWKATIIKPSKGDSPYYYHGQWDLDILVPQQYPIAPPKIGFSSKTPISHPNINFDTGEICLDILKLDNWSPAWNLQHLVGAILMLIDDPEPDSPLNVDLANLYRSDKLGFESFVQFTIWKYATMYSVTRDKSGLKPRTPQPKADPEPHIVEPGPKASSPEPIVDLHPEPSLEVTTEIINDAANDSNDITPQITKEQLDLKSVVPKDDYDQNEGKSTPQETIFENTTNISTLDDLSSVSTATSKPLTNGSSPLKKKKSKRNKLKKLINK